jgi:phage gpG-like protein
MGARRTEWTGFIGCPDEETSFDSYIVRLEIEGKKFKNMKPVIERLAKMYYQQVTTSFATESQPPVNGGRKWPILAEATVNDREKLGFGGNGPILQRTYFLYEEATKGFEEVSAGASMNTFAEINIEAVSEHSGVNYAAVHMYGSSDGKVPARKFLPDSVIMARELAKEGRRYLAFGGARPFRTYSSSQYTLPSWNE